MRNKYGALSWRTLYVPERSHITVHVLAIGYLTLIYYVYRYLGRHRSTLLSKLLRWHFISAAACLPGLAWYQGDSLVAWYRATALSSRGMDLEVLQGFLSVNFLLAFFALSWLFLRLRKVLSIPVDDLVKILGLEVPSPPSATLLEVSSNGATIHWKSPENRTSITKYVVRINGFIAGEFSHQENAVTISDLPSDRCYTIRIVAVNSSNFQSSSNPIRIKPLGDSSTQNDDKSPATNKRKRNELDTASAVQNATPHAAPTLVPCKVFPDSLASAIAPIVAREPISGYSQPKRGSTSSKHGPPTIPASYEASPQDRENEAETIQALNNKLDEIRAQTQEQEKQDEEEEAEFQKGQATLIEQRDTLKKQLKEREDESKDLSKAVRTLEHANSIAQVKRTQQEKALNEKVRVREKMQEDIQRWNKEVPEIEAEILALEQQKADVVKANEAQVLAIKADQQPDLEALASIEEQIQEQGKEVRELDNEKKKLEEEERSDSTEANERSLAMAAEERDWHDRIAQLQHQLNNAAAAFYQTQSHFSQVQQRAEMLNARRNSQANGYSHGFNSDSQSSNPDFVVQSQQQPSGMRVNFDIPEPRGNPMNSSYARTMPSSNPLYRTSSPFASSGMTMAMPSRPQTNPGGDLHANRDHLTGGAMTSPNAGDLLPSGLLGDDVEDLGRTPQPRSFPPQRRDPNLRSRPTSIASGGPVTAAFVKGSEGSVDEFNLLPGLGNIPGLVTGDTANSHPQSGSGPFASPSPSAVSSPHGSLSNLHYPRGYESHLDSDRRSIKSSSESAQNPPVSRRFDFFGRQRGKTTSDGPALGSLKPSQSQSMPRDSNDAAHAFASSRSQFRGAGGLFGQMSSAVLGRRAAATSNDPSDRSDLFNLGQAGSVSSFQSANNPWSRPTEGRRASISRPGSTYSTENALPKPAGDIPRFGWGVSRESLHRPGSIQAASTVNKPWSPFSSRRPSVQQDGESASIWEIGDAEVDSDEDQDDANSPPPAPIGTKPRKLKDQGELSKQLNPNARDFTSMFGFGRKGDKSEKATPKSKKKDKAKAQLGDDMASSMTDDSSPPDSRKSRDTLLSSNAGSFEEEGTRDELTDSHPATPQENAPHASPGGRDSLMRILSRKGSSGKFSLPTLKDKSSLFSRKANAPDEHEDDSGSSAKLGRSVENIVANPLGTPDRKSSGFSLSFKKRGRKGNDTPSISEASVSEASIASETGEEDAEEDQGELNTP